jgi:hypothetical protein
LFHGPFTYFDEKTLFKGKKRGKNKMKGDKRRREGDQKISWFSIPLKAKFVKKMLSFHVQEQKLEDILHLPQIK